MPLVRLSILSSALAIDWVETVSYHICSYPFLPDLHWGL